jgi:hypothetical protein
VEQQDVDAADLVVIDAFVSNLDMTRAIARAVRVRAPSSRAIPPPSVY